MKKIIIASTVAASLQVVAKSGGLEDLLNQAVTGAGSNTEGASTTTTAAPTGGIQLIQLIHKVSKLLLNLEVLKIFLIKL